MAATPTPELDATVTEDGDIVIPANVVARFVSVKPGEHVQVRILSQRADHGAGSLATAAQTRERLSEAGLLARIPSRSVTRPDPAVVERARKAAGKGKPLSEYVSEGRD